LWRYEGQNTLAYYLRRRDALRALARDLEVPEEIVVPVAMRQLLLGLAALHSAGLVHRWAALGCLWGVRDERY
jgi:energy-converting hydrogenase A subunit M